MYNLYATNKLQDRGTHFATLLTITSSSTSNSILQTETELGDAPSSGRESAPRQRSAPGRAPPAPPTAGNQSCSRFESLILSHHSRYKVTCECNEKDINDVKMMMIDHVFQFCIRCLKAINSSDARNIDKSSYVIDFYLSTSTRGRAGTESITMSIASVLFRV